MIEMRVTERLALQCIRHVSGLSSVRRARWYELVDLPEGERANRVNQNRPTSCAACRPVDPRLT